MTKSRNDIKVAGNMISGRQGWAYICNSAKFAITEVDMDKAQEYDTFKQYGKVKVAVPYRNDELHMVGEIEWNEGKWQIGGHGSMLKASFGYRDMTELIAGAQLPIVRKDDIIVLAHKSDKLGFAWLALFKVGRIDTNCMTMAHLEPLTEEEMQEVANDADRWCNR